MGGTPIRTHSYEQFKEEASSFLEAQMETLGLSQKQIEKQSITQLEDSLERVNDALRAPDSFGVLRLRVTASSGIAFLASNAETHIELGVVPLLLERKRTIVERLRQLRAKRKVKTLRDLIATISDQELRERLLTELEAARQKATSNKPEPKIQKGIAFVAMAMDPENLQLDDVLDAIKDGATKCGINAGRIDEARSNERITDRMLTAINESEFVVVDLSYARPNVYYEAGYAQGLGKTPVYLAREGTEIPFDLKDYPVIYYPSMRVLKAALADRLNAIGSGRK